MSARVVECDVCIIGSGISAAMVAERLVRDGKRNIVVLEAGAEQPGPLEFARLRQRNLDYGESPWPKDHIDGMYVDGMQSPTQCVGGMAMHWGGVTPRFSPEDFRQRSACGVGTDWPISYEELDPFYQEAEELIGIGGEQGPPELDPRGKPFPMPALPLNYNLLQYREWAAKAGIPMWSQPSAKLTVARPDDGRASCCRSDTCDPICPTGAKYSPDMTWRRLHASGHVTLHANTMVRRLHAAPGSERIERAVAVSGGQETEYRAKTFVVAAGYLWSSHLLLLSADARHPQGLANSSGLVGKYITGHRNVSARIALPIRLFPGMQEQHSLVSKFFMRKPRTDKYLRHDLRVWEDTVGRLPRLRDDAGKLLMGDALLADWRARTDTESTARVRGYYDVIPARNSEITLDASRRTLFGDPLARLQLRDDPVSAELRGYSEQRLAELMVDMARAGNGRVIASATDAFQDHPGGGCRMGKDPASSVVDRHGRSHDHQNLFVVGAPTLVSSGCANGTLTFSALSLMAAAEIARGLS